MIPPDTVKRLSNDLSPVCSELFTHGKVPFDRLKNGGVGYQWGKSPLKASAFAVGLSSDGQVCAYQHVSVFENQLDANRKALAGCNLLMIPNRAGCVVYAEGDKVVFDPAAYSAGGVVNVRPTAQTTINDRQKVENSSLLEKQKQELDDVTRERNRLSAEVEAERQRRQEVEGQIDRVTKKGGEDSVRKVIMQPRRVHALVVGNGAYRGGGRLANPVNDADLVANKLRAMGFSVFLVKDASRQSLVDSLARFKASAKDADLSIFYYAGHAVQIFGTNYLFPVDINQTDLAQASIQGISVSSVVENVMPGRTKLVFLDACRNNPLINSNERGFSSGLAPINAGEGTLISYATKDGSVALDGEGSKNSPYTQALVAHLGDPQDIGVVLRKVREDVMKYTGGKQQPWDYGNLTGGELILSLIKNKVD